MNIQEVVESSKKGQTKPTCVGNSHHFVMRASDIGKGVLFVCVKCGEKKWMK